MNYIADIESIALKPKGMHVKYHDGSTGYLPYYVDPSMIDDQLDGSFVNMFPNTSFDDAIKTFFMENPD